MHKEVLSGKAVEILGAIRPWADDFYLGGGTGLALQLGHRLSEDLDFFSPLPFDVEWLLNQMKPEKTSLIRQGTLHCIKDGVKLSFLFYDIKLKFQTPRWNGIRIGAWEDIVGERLKTISQRGAKKDFYDLYAVILIKSNIREVCRYFLNRFKETGINIYHVLKSIVYFADAEDDPPPILLKKGKEWEWDYIKRYFEKNVREFEDSLILTKK